MGTAPAMEPLPKIELKPFQQAVNEAAARVRGTWLGYIVLLAYLFIAVGAVTHRDLLLENPVTLPVLNVGLPLTGFFLVAPIFFLINHFYLLLQLLGLARRIREFNDAIAKTGLDQDARRRERRKLDTFVIVQMLGGTREEREQLTGKFLKTIALITLVIAPTLLLLTIQLQFLPYQSEPLTWWHRFTLGIDLALLWVFWPAIKLGDWAPRRISPARATAVFPILFFSIFVATFPGETSDDLIHKKDWKKPEDSNLSWLKSRLFGDLGVGKKRQRLIPFSRALDLAGNTTLIDLDKFDKIKNRDKENSDNLNPWQTGRTLDLRQRNLRGAVFDGSDLRNVYFDDANLQGASLRRVNLQGASLRRASLQGASLRRARLQGASLWRASLQGAVLDDARLQGAVFQQARLQSAWLRRASLQGAVLSLASLQGAVLVQARLHGAVLWRASLQGASLDGARLQGARLSGAYLQGASLTKTFLWRAYGAPRTGNPTLAWVKEPILENLEEEQVAKLKKDALVGVGSKVVKQRIKKRLERLSLPKTKLDNKLAKSYWTGLADKRMSLADHQKDLASRLETLACEGDNAPYVAQGLMWAPQEEGLLFTKKIPSRLEAIGNTNLQRVARILLDAAEGRTTNCPGVKGLNASSMGKLREWAAKTKQTNPAAVKQ